MIATNVRREEATTVTNGSAESARENSSTYEDLFNALDGCREIASDQVHAILSCLVDVCVADQVPVSIASTVFDEVGRQDREFHSLRELPKGSENWRKTKVRLLYPHEIKINAAAFRKRATRHVRAMIKFEQMLPLIEAYFKRKSGKVA